MFGKEGETMEGAETIVGVDVVVKGNLKSPSNIAINGTVKGQVVTSTDVMIGESAKIEGSVNAKKVTVSGEVRGNIESGESLVINPSGKVFGDITTPNLVIESGATFVGKSTMPEAGQASEQVGNEAEAKEIFEEALNEEEKVETTE